MVADRVPARGEKAQAASMARAAKAADLKHVVWSTLDDSRRFIPLSDARMPTLMGTYKVPHFDAKAESDRYFAQSGVPTTFLLTSFYWENLIYFGMGPRASTAGELVWAMPLGSARLPGIGAEDIGRCAYGIFKRGRDLTGEYVGIAGEQLTGTEMAVALSSALGKPVRYDAITPAQYRALGFPGADDLGNMFQFNVEFAAEFCGARDIAAARALNPALQTFSQWLHANKERIPLA